MQLETVKIVVAKSDDNPLGYIVINKSDLADGMQPYQEPAPEKTAAELQSEADAKAAADKKAADDQAAADAAAKAAQNGSKK